MKLITLDKVYESFFISQCNDGRSYFVIDYKKRISFKFWQYCEYLKQEGYRII